MAYSDSDFERFYLRYMAEAMPRGESIQSFCCGNKVPYNKFDKWYTDSRHRTEPVQSDLSSLSSPLAEKYRFNPELMKIIADQEGQLALQNR